jgi:hypothetical protein
VLCRVQLKSGFATRHGRPDCMEAARISPPKATVQTTWDIVQYSVKKSWVSAGPRKILPDLLCEVGVTASEVGMRVPRSGGGMWLMYHPLGSLSRIGSQETWSTTLSYSLMHSVLYH